MNFQQPDASAASHAPIPISTNAPMTTAPNSDQACNNQTSHDQTSNLSQDLQDEGTVTGMVLAAQANFYRVFLDQPQGEITELLCTRRARLKKIGQQICVGDHVTVAEPDWQGGRGAIAQVAPRRNQLDRPMIANVDRLLLVFALADPPLEPMQISRFLVKAESTGLEILLGLSKRDLVTDAEYTQWQNRLQSWGYDPIAFSTYDNEHQAAGYAALRTRLVQGITVISGPSGVGKSSLINQLIPDVDLRVGAVSERLGHGRHTTRHAELFALPTGGYLADTPGFMQPDLTILPHELAELFPEARQRLDQQDCQFNDCLHHNEPHCAVRGDWERYGHYLAFLAETQAQHTKQKMMGHSESSLKSKTHRHGQTVQEPRLNQKRYRRTSRHTAHQTVAQDLTTQDLVQDALGEI
ncbi:MAG: small ribosomal subunit biogenesis GTPase RsgA [Pseudanabaenaceae cyanobacterium]